MLAATGAVFAPPAASAASYGPGSLVSDVPVNGTPHVLDGRVNSIVQVGNTIILGGQFTQTRNNSSETVIARANLVAFDATTKEISTTFAPNPNGTVNVVLPTGDGETVYVGGSFTTIGGSDPQEPGQGSRVGRRRGHRVQRGERRRSGQGSPAVERSAVGRRWLHPHRQRRQLGLATLNPTTGALNQYMRRVIAGTSQRRLHDRHEDRHQRPGHPAGCDRQLRHHRRGQEPPALRAGPQRQRSQRSRRSTPRSTRPPARASFDTYMRDLDFSPDGTLLRRVDHRRLRRRRARPATAPRASRSKPAPPRTPSWVNNTGGDTTYAVEITDSVVYTGGHARWQNNPFRADRAGQGAVSRPGIAALDPINGLPLSWNPTRDRGVGVFDFLFTEQGLWVGSDTTRIGADYLRSRIALLPVGGTQFPGVRTPTLPNDVYAVRTAGIDRRSYSGSAFSAAQPVPGGGMATSNIRGSFMLNGNLYIAWSNGTFDRRSFDGTTYGTPVAVDTASELTAVHRLDRRRREHDRALLRLRAALLHPERLPRNAVLPVLHAGERRRRRAAADGERAT